MRARLSEYSGRLRGVWEEKTFRALGTISGKITKNKINFIIAGNIFGKMNVVYSERRQSVVINTRGIPLENVEIEMRRR